MCANNKKMPQQKNNELRKIDCLLSKMADAFDIGESVEKLTSDKAAPAARFSNHY